jgi:hypothetical protein
MRLSWNEIRARAAHFADEWKDAGYEKGESQTFYNEFFDIFGVTRRRVASFEEPVKKLDAKHGFIDLFWKGVLLVEQKSAGGNLTKAKQQAFDYFPGLKEAELPRHVLVSDFQTFGLYDLEEDTEQHFVLSDLHKNIEHFGFILGVEKRTFRDQDPVNIEASELMGEVHDALKASGYQGHDLEQLLVRLVFCLFADDTGIFEPRGIFQELVEQRTAEDGSDIGLWLSQLFDVLDTPIDRRQKTLDEDLQKFPYVNGDLFHERLRISSFDSTMRNLLLKTCSFSWDAISPAIFGALFQSVMNAQERRASGSHYTTERNILKVIQPLFLDELREEFAGVKARRDTGRTNSLKNFHDKLGGLTFFDPACGCGNFLIIAYRELRALEIEVLRELNPRGQRVIDVSALSKIDVNQFYGIEISEFPVRIAEVALWMMDHIMNNRLSLEFGESYVRIPLRSAPHIHHADALEVDWATVLPSKNCSYVLGNPPFVGAKLQTDAQREQVRRIAQLGGGGGTLDYVAAWFLKAAHYLRDGRALIGFVATNSITQGEQVAQLWPVLFGRYGLEIAFAHRTFAWGSDARGRAHVHVVIVGLTRRDMEFAKKRLFNYEDINGDPTESQHRALTAYLFGADTVENRHLVVAEASRPLSGQPRMIIGSKPIDDGNYIFTDFEHSEFLAREPKAASLLRPFVGADDFINGRNRWILCFKDAEPGFLRTLPLVLERIAAVKAFRLGRKSAPTKALGQTPMLYHVNVIPDRPFLVIPRHSSERRSYVPFGWLEPPAIPGDSSLVILDAERNLFAILTSRMHMAWLSHIGGRLESRFRYSAGLVYNPFPFPVASATDRARLDVLAQAILDARGVHQGATLADLYDPDVMPENLRKAHRLLDLAVDKLYRPAAFGGDRERVEHLFGLYEKLMSPLIASLKQKKSKKG